MWLQLFGESADAEDFSVSAGGYGAAAESARAEPVSSPVNTAWDGIGGVLWAPWAWVLVALGVRGIYRMAGSARSGPPRGLSRR